jgi:hypothetical protein
MNISLEMVGLDMAHRREMKQLTQNAQGIIDQQAAEIMRLRRELQKANGIINRLSVSNGELIRERGIRGNQILAAAVQRRRAAAH